jgi:uncharacterized membrane protein (Fun14 family)
MVETISSLVTSLLPQILSGGGVGFVGGWLAKKVLKIVMYVAAFFAGLIGAGVAYAESQGWVTVTVHWDAISASAQGLLTSATSSLGSLSSVLTSLTAFSGPALVAAYLGFKRG